MSDLRDKVSFMQITRDKSRIAGRIICGLVTAMMMTTVLSACSSESRTEEKGSDLPTLATIARECDIHFFYKEQGKWSLNAVTGDEFDCVVERGLPTKVADSITEAQASGDKTSGNAKLDGRSYQWSISGIEPRITINEM
ncbi:hypothetical protein [Bifidobacterium sp. SO4]|uniref:hypothetical protein n=1 Tax=Bifidobacterium sp. SO4 TaxID=2809030 RepID=UPI001BDDA47B|nr:hypothetical protein [Bifidobacterium sp. SO4]MBT1170378.1 hypothetical protein [Bifidobacterium sp. SO4]